MEEVGYYFGLHVYQVSLVWISFYKKMRKVTLIQQNLDQ